MMHSTQNQEGTKAAWHLFQYARFLQQQELETPVEAFNSVAADYHGLSRLCGLQEYAFSGV
jgi:hypothetical protein